MPGRMRVATSGPHATASDYADGAVPGAFLTTPHGKELAWLPSPGFVPITRMLTAGAGFTSGSGGDLSADRSFVIGENADGSIRVNTHDVQVGVLATDAQHGNRGGGNQHSVVTPLSNGFMSPAMLVALANTVPQSRILTAGAGFTSASGGNLSADRSFVIGENADGSIVVNTHDVQVGVLATDAQHGNRAGGNQHSVVTPLSNGFMSPAMLATISPVATSRITFAPGTRNVPIYTVPASPSGLGRLILARCLVRVALALVGSGSITFSVGSTSGGTQIILPIVITSSTAETIIAGEAIASLGLGMPSSNAYEAIFSAGQVIYANLTKTGTVTDGYVDVYLYALLVSA
jgi:hypothetical protein